MQAAVTHACAVCCIGACCFVNFLRRATTGAVMPTLCSENSRRHSRTSKQYVQWDTAQCKRSAAHCRAVQGAVQHSMGQCKAGWGLVGQLMTGQENGQRAHEMTGQGQAACRVTCSSRRDGQLQQRRCPRQHDTHISAAECQLSKVPPPTTYTVDGRRVAAPVAAYALVVAPTAPICSWQLVTVSDSRSGACSSLLQVPHRRCAASSAAAIRRVCN